MSTTKTPFSIKFRSVRFNLTIYLVHSNYLPAIRTISIGPCWYVCGVSSRLKPSKAIHVQCVSHFRDSSLPFHRATICWTLIKAVNVEINIAVIRTVISLSPTVQDEFCAKREICTENKQERFHFSIS